MGEDGGEGDLPRTICWMRRGGHFSGIGLNLGKSSAISSGIGECRYNVNLR